MKLKYLWMVMACGMFMACEEAGQIGQELAMTEQAVVEEISKEGTVAAEYGMNEMGRDFSTLAEIYDAMGAVFAENPDNCSAVVEELRVFVTDRKESFRHSMQRIFDNGMRLKAEHSEELQDALDSTMERSFRATTEIMRECFDRWDKDCSREVRLVLSEMSTGIRKGA